jgi:hypothetical protein
MDEAKVLVICGLSLSPADAELAQVVATGLDFGSVEEVLVADPSHGLVCARIYALLRKRTPSVVGCDPSSPFNRTTYA